MTTIAWIDGRWGPPADLSLPLSDRGLQLADGWFETVLIEAGQPRLLREHLQRWQEGAALLGLQAPPAIETLEPLIAEAIDRSPEGAACGALRLNWSRGEIADPQASRGIGLPKANAPQPQPRFWLQLTPIQLDFRAITAIVSRQEQRNASSQLSRCKTFAYNQAIAARREAQACGADDALLLSSGGGLSCGSTANLLVQRQGRWLTPPLSSGCLPGIMRRRSLELGLAEEAPLQAQPQPGDHWLLINSLGCRPLRQLDGQLLPTIPAAEDLWRSLL